MSFTRKTRRSRKQRAGGFFDFLSSGTSANTAALNLKAKRNYDLAHSKSRVANVLAKPGQVTYTNKAAIQERYEKAIQQLQSLEKPKETFTALQRLSNSLNTAIESDAAREAGAVVITIPFGVAQLAAKAIRVFLSIMIVIFIDLPLGFLSGSPAVNVAASVAPNTRFNSTQAVYQKARNFTGAKKGVENY